MWPFGKSKSKERQDLNRTGARNQDRRAQAASRSYDSSPGNDASYLALNTAQGYSSGCDSASSDSGGGGGDSGGGGGDGGGSCG